MPASGVNTSARWKQLCFLASGLCIIQFLFLLLHSLPDSSTPGVLNKFKFPTFPSNDIGNLLAWDHLPTGSDGEFLDNLSEAQCHHAFPDSYKDIDRAVAYWRGRNHTITSADTSIDWMKGDAFRVLIHQNNVRVLEGKKAFGGGRARMTLFQLHRAVESASAGGEMLPTVEIAYSMTDWTPFPEGDEDTHTVWTWDRDMTERGHRRGNDRIWLIPNYNMWVRDTRPVVKQHDTPFAKKIPQLVWRGATWVNPDLRGKLIEVTANQTWADVAMVDNEHRGEWINNIDLCKYAMTVYTEGVSYSGRLKWLTDCNSLLFAHELEWDMRYLHLLEPSGPNQNYVSVKRDWSDLEEKVQYYLAHPQEAERIIDNMLSTFRERYMTRAAISCYYRGLIKAYAEVSETPETHRPATDLTPQPKGESYEMFIANPRDFHEYKPDAST